MAQKLREHQEIALPLIKNGSVITAGVGVGKTYLALAYYVSVVCGGDLDRETPPIHPKRLVVITTAKKRDDLDWEKEGLHYNLSPNTESSYIPCEFIVDSWNNMGKYVGLSDTFFIFDEQRLVGTGAWVKTFLKIVKQPGNEWIMLSATPADTWADYIPLFIAHGFYRNRTHFHEEHVVWTFHGRYRKIRGFYGVRHLRKLRDSILVEVPYDRHTTRHLESVPVEYDVSLFDKIWKRRWNIYEDVPLIDVAEMHRLARKLVNSDPSRGKALEELSAKHPRLIVFYSFDYELEILREVGARLGLEVAEWNGHKHHSVPTSDRWLYLVQYQAGAEGWNCIATDAIVFYSLTYSHKLFEQAQGRIDRLNTPFSDLWYYILMSDSRIEKLIWRALTLKKNFHEGRNIKFDQAA